MNTTPAKIILFGGSGFLGPIILQKYPEIISVGRRPPPDYIPNTHLNVPTLDDLSRLDALDFDQVIFLIGNSNHHLINQHPTLGLDANVWPLKKALAYFQKRAVKKFVCFTTILLYDPDRLKLPVDETQPLNPYLNDYVFSKYLSEEVVRFYAPSVPSIIIRFSNIYGPTKLIRPDLVPTLIQQLLSPQTARVWSTKPGRDFLFLDDAAEAIVKLMATDYTGVINLGTGRETSVGEVVAILEELSGKKIIDLQQAVSGPMHFRCDISRVTQLTGWTPRHTLAEGLRQTFEQMKAWAI